MVLRDLYDSNPANRKIFKDLSLGIKLDVKIAVDQTKEYLELSSDKRKIYSQNSDAFINYRKLLEDNGVFVFQYPIKEVGGFSLMDKEFPVIVVNSSDSLSAKIFTISHELCHILFNTGGVFRNIITEELKLEIANIEQFCNAFASEFLVPAEEFKKFILENYTHNDTWNDDMIRSVASSFNVSKEVILRKLLDLNLTNRQDYAKLVKKWNEQYFKLKEIRKNKKGGPSYQTLVISHLGKRFVYNILDNYHSGKLDAVSASNFLGVKVNQLSKIEDKLY